jgi:hypothetical protein
MMSRTVPTGAGWAYEIKHDGFRFICRRDGERVRAFSRGGHDWSAQLPAIAEAMRAFPVTSVTLDGEVVICGADGVSQFDRMRAMFGRHGSREAFLYAFDILELDGQELRAGSGGIIVEHCWRSCSLKPTQASGYASTSRAPTAPSCSAPRATWDWKTSSPSGATAATAPGAAGIGSRSRILRTRRSNAPC